MYGDGDATATDRGARDAGSDGRCQAQITRRRGRTRRRNPFAADDLCLAPYVADLAPTVAGHVADRGPEADGVSERRARGPIMRRGEVFMRALGLVCLAA